MNSINDDYAKDRIDYHFRERQLNSYKSFISICGNTQYMDNMVTSNPIMHIAKNKKGGTSYKIARKYDKNGRLILKHSAYLSDISIYDCG